LKTALRWTLLAVVLAGLSGCSGCPYSFTGSSVPAHLKTIGIPLFDDQSGSGEPGLRELLTNKLIARFRQDNSLEIADKTRADSMIEGAIVSVSTQPNVITAGETVSRNRVTISAKAAFQDLKLKKKVYDKQYSEWGDYDISGGPEQRQAAIDAALEKLAEDILLETVSGW
jgi:hypothetical protein